MGSLLMVEACSETDREFGELVSELVQPKEKQDRQMSSQIENKPTTMRL